MHNITYDLILLSAGRGRRLGGKNKGLLRIDNRSFIEYELDIISKTILPQRIIITYHPSVLSELRNIIRNHSLFDRITLIKGGSERVFSVYNALSALRESDSQLVLIHDAARPNISADLIKRGINVAIKKGSAIPAIPLTDTIKLVNNGRITRTISRENIYYVQTPQIFNKELITYAYDEWYSKRDNFIHTDDASLLENLGISPFIFAGERCNIKITFREDMDMIKRDFPYRIGYGYDIHRLKKGGRLFLGGVMIDNTRSAIAHSDGDVLLHSLCDALLGAAGLRDIGYYFPNSESKYKGISSLKILEKTYEIISKRGFSVVNIDITVILESPKIGKFIDDMKKNIAQILKIDKTYIGIKATTSEKTGETSRGKAFSSYCVAMIRR